MRPFVALLIWIIMVGGTGLYMHQRPAPPAKAGHASISASGMYSLEITTTFDAEPDPFALKGTAEDEPAALVVKLNGKEILRRSETLTAGIPIEIRPLAGLVTGPNEFYVEAAPPQAQSNRSQAIRVRVFMDADQIMDRSIWSEPGIKAAAALQLSVADAHPETRHDH